MKKLIIIISLILFYCTSKRQANTIIICPCIVDKIEITKDSESRVRFISIVKSNDSYFWFYTKYKYYIGDTIK